MNDSIDVIIPVYRPDEKLGQLIERLNHQTKKPEHIWFLQTMEGTEEDEKVQRLLEQAERGRIIPIKKQEFDHGGTRNLGASHSQADYMLFMTQDAVPADDVLLETLIRHLDSDERIAAAYARQLPGGDVGPVERFTRAFNYPQQSAVKDAADLERLGIKTYFCSNVCAMYRRCIYEELGGFVLHTIFNEDMIFAAALIDAGYKIAYAADAAVIHAHKYTYRQQFSRNFDMAVSQRQYRHIFERVKSESEGVRLVKDTAKHLLRTGRWYLLPDLALQSACKLLGYKFGLRYESLPQGLVKKMSMNKRYWDKN